MNEGILISLPRRLKSLLLRNMALQSRRDIIAMHLSRTDDEVIFPLIPHIAPIWPPDKRIENVKARRTTFRRLVRNKMIFFKFLQSINPSMKDMLSEVADKADDADSIVNLTRNFQEEQRKKHQRIFEIQTEAYLRAERKKPAWGKVREDEYKNGWQKLPRTSHLVASNGNSNNLPSQTLSERHVSIAKIEESTSMIVQREIQLSRRGKDGELVFPEKNDVIYFPQIYNSNKEVKRPVNDPRFQRLLTSLVPPASKREIEFRHIRNSDSHGTKDAIEYRREYTLQSRLSAKSLHDKWLETMTPQYHKNNVSTSIYN